MLDKVRSKYILQEIFIKIKNKRKLNIIKYNKRIKDKLKINIKDYKIYISLREFNIKYNINIEDIDEKELNLSKRYLGNEGLKDLCKIEFKELKILCLGSNYISDINALENAKFEKLEILKLGNNNISDINILEKVNFKELKILKLFKNNISDLNVLDKLKFKKLKLFI